MDIFSCECKASFSLKKPPKPKGCYPYSHVKCPACLKKGGVFYQRTLIAHNVISDQIATPFKSQGDGNFYDSKSAYYKSLKRKGLAIAETSTVEYRKPESFNEKAFDGAFKKALEQHGH